MVYEKEWRRGKGGERRGCQWHKTTNKCKDYDFIRIDWSEIWLIDLKNESSLSDGKDFPLVFVRFLIVIIIGI